MNPTPPTNGNGKNKGGRPTKLTPQVIDIIERCLRAGLTYERAAIVAGVSYSQFGAWKAKKPWFSAAVKKAEAEGQLYHLDKIRKATSWQASAWFLERKYPHEWARTEILTIEGRKKALAAELGAATSPEMIAAYRDIRIALGLPLNASQALVDEKMAQARMNQIRRAVVGDLDAPVAPLAPPMPAPEPGPVGPYDLPRDPYRDARGGEPKRET